MAGRVRVLSERFMVPGKETAVKKLMLEVEQNVRKQAGFVRGEYVIVVYNKFSYTDVTI